MNLTIRKAVVSDAGVIADLNSRLAEETEQMHLDRNLVRKGAEALTRDPSKGFYLVAEDAGRVIGQLMITCEWSDWRNGTFWWIQSVYVRREYRGRGVYTGLHRQVEKMARERGDIRGLRLYVEKNNETAQRSYRRLGMSETNYQMYAIDFVLGRGKPASRETRPRGKR